MIAEYPGRLFQPGDYASLDPVGITRSTLLSVIICATITPVIRRLAPSSLFQLGLLFSGAKYTGG